MKDKDGKLIIDKIVDAFHDDRKPTTEVLHLMIQSPDVFHNPPRHDTGNKSYISINTTYSDLWGGASKTKTIYDPCPVGYRVASYNAFSGFITTGNNIVPNPQWLTPPQSYTYPYEDYLYEVILSNIHKENPKDNLYEFYTNPDKYKSIIFPETGYRDWDANATAYQINSIGYSWAREVMNANGKEGDPDTAYYLEFSRNRTSDKAILPHGNFYTAYGCPIRPCKE